MITKSLSILYGRFGLLCAIAAILVFSVGSTSAVYAQDPDSDGDGLPDSVDRCPNEAGPRDNDGCPYPDTDGDGTPDSVDRCPNEAGPRDNGGCPRPPEPPPDQPPAPAGDPGAPPTDPDQLPPVDPDVPAEPPVLLLPALPEDGPCVVATQSVEGVNIRMLPGTAEGIIIVNSLDPQLLYPVVMSVETSEGVWWMLKQGGFAASWVTRQGGNCDMLPFVQLALAEDHFVFQGHALLDPNQPSFLPLLVFFDKTGVVQEAWFAGFVSPGEISGFNPQPDPPGDDVSAIPPDPDQPPPFFLMLSMDDGGMPSGDEAGIVIIGGKPSGDEAGIIVIGGGMPSGDENGIIITGGMPSGDEAGIIIIGGKPSGDEAGLVINWLPSGDEVGFIIEGGMPSGDENGIVIVGGMPSGDEVGMVIDGGMPSGDENGIIIVGGMPSADEVGMIIDGGMPSGDEAGIIINWLIGDSGIIIDYAPGDGSVEPDDSGIIIDFVPGDGSVPGDESAFCDGSVMPGDGTLRPTESLMGDGSVMPGNLGVMFCDGSVSPTPDDGSPTPGDEVGMVIEGGMPTDEAGIIDDNKMPSWLLPAMVFPGGGGEELGCSNNLLPASDQQLGGPDTAPTATCMFTDGKLLALCGVSSEEAFCMYSDF